MRSVIVSCGFGVIYSRNPKWKTSFICAVDHLHSIPFHYAATIITEFRKVMI